MTAQTPAGVLRQAMAAARAGDRARTRGLLLSAVRADPRNEAAWQWLAGVADTPLEAFAALEKAVGLNPANETARAAFREARLQAGVAAAKAKDIPTANKLLRAAVADDPAGEQGWLWLAAVCDSPTEALAHLHKVLGLNPGNSAAKKGVEYYQAKLKKAQAGEASVSGAIRAIAPDPAPAARPQSGAIPAPAARRPAAPRADRRLLVVDESRTIRKLVAMSAAGDGYRVLEAGDAGEAAAKIQEDGPPDVIVVDAALPGVDGYEFCKLVRQNPATKRVPVVLMTGRDGLFDKIRGAVAGVTAVLAKPLDPDELAHALRALAGGDPADAPALAGLSAVGDA